jgi:hypothetical protein
LEANIVSTSESQKKPEPMNDEPPSLQYPPRIPSLFMVVGPIVAAAVVVGVVVLAALTSWWVLFALFALPPLMMMVCGPVMMTAMRGSTGSGFSAAGWCPPWRGSEVDRTTWAD